MNLQDMEDRGKTGNVDSLKVVHLSHCWQYFLCGSSPSSVPKTAHLTFAILQDLYVKAEEQRLSDSKALL